MKCEFCKFFKATDNRVIGDCTLKLPPGVAPKDRDPVFNYEECDLGINKFKEEN